MATTVDPALRTNYEVRVGLFALGALILFIWGWAWLKSSSLFHKPQRFTARFDDVAGLSANATVNVQGVRSGTVEALAFTPDHKIDCHIKITNDSISVPRGSDISIQTLGLVGAKYIEIFLPKDENGKIKDGPPLQETDILAPPGEGNSELGIVHNPVRVEVIVNNFATRFDEIVSNIDPKMASKAINNFNNAALKLNKNMDKLKDAAESVKNASNNIAVTSEKFGKTADNAAVASERASTFFRDGDSALKTVGDLAHDFQGTNRRVNKLLDNPNFSADVRETLIQARQTAETVRGAMADLSATLKDKDVRTDVLSSLGRLQQATENIRNSLQTVSKISNDQGLRSDLKEVVKNAKEAVSGANAILSDPTFKTDLGQTMAKVKEAAGNVEVASKQVQQVLSKRAPLLHMLFGSPGKLTPDEANPNAPAPKCPPGTVPIKK